MIRLVNQLRYTLFRSSYFVTCCYLKSQTMNWTRGNRHGSPTVVPEGGPKHEINLMGTEKSHGGPEKEKTQQLPPPAVYRSIGKGRSLPGCGGCCCRLFCCLFCLLFGLIIAVGILALVLFLVYRPKAPTFSVENAQVHDFSVGVNSAANIFHLNGTVNVTLKVGNPNKFSIHYGETNITGYYRGILLNSTQVPPFVGEKHAVHNITAGFAVTEVALNSTAGPLLVSDVAADSVSFQIYTDGKATLKIWGVTLPKASVKVVCDIAISPQTQEVKDKSCKVVKAKIG